MFLCQAARMDVGEPANLMERSEHGILLLEDCPRAQSKGKQLESLELRRLLTFRQALSGVLPASRTRPCHVMIHSGLCRASHKLNVIQEIWTQL